MTDLFYLFVVLGGISAVFSAYILIAKWMGWE
jgi:hypothetical protein